MGNRGYKNLYKRGKAKGVDLLTIAFCTFLLLFPVDSALGGILGSFSINNLVAIACVGLLFFSSRTVTIGRKGLSAAIFIYLAFQCVTMSYSPLPLSGRNLVMVFYCVFALLMGGVEWKKREKELMIVASVLGGVCSFAIVLLDAATSSAGRTFITLGSYIDPNYFGLNFIFTTAILANSLFTCRRKILIGLLLLLDFIALLYLGTRSGLFANIAVLLTVLCLKVKNPKLYYIGIPTIIAAYCLAMFVLPEWMVKRFDLKNIFTSTGSGRTTIWKFYLKTYGDAPLFNKLFGFGRSSIYAGEEFGFHANCTHNFYLKALIEGGIFGVGFLAFLFFHILRQIKRSKNKSLYALLIGYCIGGIFLDVDDYRIAYALYAFAFIFTNDEFVFPNVAKERTWFHVKKPNFAGEEPLVSVIVPVYNVAAYVEECVRSITAQTYRNLEIILVDDGSTDGSGALCDELAKEDSRIRVLHTPNGGVARTRNVGVSAARGALLTFVDGDDALLPDCIERLAALQRETGAELTATDFYRDEKTLGNKKTERYALLSPSDVVLEMLNEKFTVSPWGKLYKRSLFDGIVFPDGFIYEDYFAIPRVAAKANKVAYLDAYLYYYRPNGQSITGVAFNPNRMQFFEIAKRMEEYVEKEFPAFTGAVKMRHTRYAVSFYRQVAASGFSDEEIEKALIRWVRKGILRYCVRADAPFTSKAYGLLVSVCPWLAKKIMRKKKA